MVEPCHRKLKMSQILKALKNFKKISNANISSILVVKVIDADRMV